MTRIVPSLALVLALLSACAPMGQTSRAYNDDLLNGIGAVSGMPGAVSRASLVGPGWDGVY